ncbi:hypothetical protein EJ05DRAFT_499321 [Pseudovirgaria hyperparasitica]|uniref:Nucleolar protein 16 n=1 Tax=Pseudovirgaria hyperparasitica TaxID=470096 RepID=A0A6A6WBA5_9PEZI|nr:uncharacterized protein EJ05DRAFT_499321 [Pseudovirgaria hyperparasitica]KAF2758887.1 hypothetical protein EJ05DRAFT_499321 [Pseudovirgaria hyperparasitica]
MGRELQKKKNRSSNPRVRQKPKSKKKILTNPIIAANWNQKETLTQNYRRLGLVSKLNKRTGGIDKTPLQSTSAAPQSTDAFLINGPGSTPLNPKSINPAEVSVTRDPATGRIISVDTPVSSNPLNDPLHGLDSDDDDNEEWTAHEFAHVPEKKGGESGVVRVLEEQARSGRRKTPRKQSDREQEWIADLVRKYGEDYARMARDRKLNPMQQTTGELKRRVEKWKKDQKVAEE